MRHRRRALTLAVLVALAAFAGGFALARRLAASAEAGAAAGAAEALDAPAPFLRLSTGGAGAPSWAPTARGTLPTVGSIFRNRYAAAESPLDGIEAVLLSPRESERLDDCPLALRLVRRDAAARGVAA